MTVLFGEAKAHDIAGRQEYFVTSSFRNLQPSRDEIITAVSSKQDSTHLNFHHKTPARPFGSAAAPEGLAVEPDRGGQV